jgi:para-aminobenzoate synthetase/4-amino-4-deoxychorismate lyase
MPSARFDDLTPGSERSFRLVDPVDVIEARETAEVATAIAAAEHAAAGGRWVGGFVSYEAAPGLDRALVVRSAPEGDPFADVPLVWFGVFAGREPIRPPEPSAPDRRIRGAEWRATVPRERYVDAVAQIREAITEGRTYQVNHTIRLRSSRFAPTEERYEQLCLAQRGGFAALLDTGRYRILSASPELFFLRDGTSIVTRPMKGTAPRGRWLAEDLERASSLTSSTKDRAENAMIVDLLRNDLGRIADPATVRVDRLFEAERYETVWQLTSTISARVPEAASLLDVFSALFPSGSVTGAPKVAAMRFIRELEDSRRGVYTGAVGFLAPAGSGEPSAEFNVAIRTIVADMTSGEAEYGVGGGITFDSSPDGEYDEVVAKSKVLTAARPAFRLLETLRWDPAGGFAHLDEHLMRLRSSARYFGFACDQGDVLTALRRSVADATTACRVRMTLGRDGEAKVDVGELPAASEGHVVVALDTDPVDPNDVWLYHKTTMREPYDRRRERRPDVDDVLLVNDRGEVTESTIANVAVKLDGRWWTPPIDAGLLPGTNRAILLREGTLAERRIALEQLPGAEGLALVSSVRGWRPATIVG